MSIGLWAQVVVLLMDCYIGLLGHVIYRLCIWVELPVQRRLCPIFVREVRSPDIHEYFHGLTGSQRTPGFWGVTVRAFTIGNLLRMSRKCMGGGDDHLAWKHPVSSEVCKRLRTVGGYDRSY